MCGPSSPHLPPSWCSGKIRFSIFVFVTYRVDPSFVQVSTVYFQGRSYKFGIRFRSFFLTVDSLPSTLRSPGSGAWPFPTKRHHSPKRSRNIETMLNFTSGSPGQTISQWSWSWLYTAMRPILNINAEIYCMIDKNISDNIFIKETFVIDCFHTYPRTKKSDEWFFFCFQSVRFLTSQSHSI